MSALPILLNGQWVHGDSALVALDPYSQSPATETTWASPAQIEAGIAGLVAAAPDAAALPTHRRYDILRGISASILQHADAFVQLIVHEAGKPLRYAQQEVQRASQTFGLAADYIRSLRDELLHLDHNTGQEGRLGLVTRQPLGPVLCITPYNFPLNLVAHKLAPAVMAGNPIFLKPSEQTPGTALLLARIVLDAGWPPQALCVLPFARKLGAQVVPDPRLHLLSFTGSAAVGWQLKAIAGQKKVVLELGGDAAAVVAEEADLDAAATQCAQGAFAYAGQVCISVQRIIVHTAVYDIFREKLLAATVALVVGNPAEAATHVGPIIDSKHYQRVLDWLDEARAAGATLHLGGQDAAHHIIRPTVLEQVPAHCRVASEEAFAPVVLLQRADNWTHALQLVNQSRYGLQAGIFTNRADYIRKAYAALQVGAVVVNAAPSLRIDAMPYGGIRESGLGREGLRYAYEDMTEPRLLLW